LNELGEPATTERTRMPLTATIPGLPEAQYKEDLAPSLARQGLTSDQVGSAVKNLGSGMQPRPTEPSEMDMLKQQKLEAEVRNEQSKPNAELNKTSKDVERTVTSEIRSVESIIKSRDAYINRLKNAVAKSKVGDTGGIDFLGLKEDGYVGGTDSSDYELELERQTGKYSDLALAKKSLSVLNGLRTRRDEIAMKNGDPLKEYREKMIPHETASNLVDIAANDPAIVFDDSEQTITSKDGSLNLAYKPTMEALTNIAITAEMGGRDPKQAVQNAIEILKKRQEAAKRDPSVVGMSGPAMAPVPPQKPAGWSNTPQQQRSFYPTPTGTAPSL